MQEMTTTELKEYRLAQAKAKKAAAIAANKVKSDEAAKAQAEKAAAAAKAKAEKAAAAAKAAKSVRGLPFLSRAIVTRRRRHRVDSGSGRASLSAGTPI